MRLSFHSRPSLPPASRIVFASLLLFATPAGSAPAPKPWAPPPNRHAKPLARPRLSAWLERMRAAESDEMRDRRHTGGRGREPLEKRDESVARAPAPMRAEPEGSMTPLATASALATDARANDRIPLTCAVCQNQPIAQDEATVAVDGVNILIGWNDIDSRCGLRSRQNYGYSTDGGVTFTDGGGYPPTDVGGQITGDPSHAVNHKTGAFYVGTLHGGGTGGGGGAFTGVGAVKGHFSGGSFVLDKLTRPVTSPGLDFFDKPWMTADSLSGSTYFSWTDFKQDGGNFLEFRRCDADLNPLGPIQTMSDTAGRCGAQFSQMAVGPDGELYVIWLDYDCGVDRIDAPVSIAIRRSNDFGATFGPITLIAEHPVCFSNGGPGFLRFFASLQPSIAVDCTNGPHRGRVYVSWDESVNYLAAPLLETTTKIEVEPNNTTATATAFVPGGKLRGIKNGVDTDWFRIDMQAGQTYHQADVFNLSASYDSTREDVSCQMYAVGTGGTLRLVANGAIDLMYSAPRTASYFLKVFGSTSSVISKYVFFTSLVNATPGERSRDIRDQVVTHSDDGTTWSTPQRVNDSAPGFDGQYPSLAVDGRGRVYCEWQDFREDTLTGAASTEYLSASGDGGVTWGANHRVGDATSFWSTNVCQSNGNNMGDYQHLAADRNRVVLAFTDARLGDPDIFSDASVFDASATAPAELFVAVGDDTSYQVQFANGGNFSRELTWRLEDSAGWLSGGPPALSGTPTLATGETLPIAAVLHRTNPMGSSTTVRFIHSDALIPGFADTTTTPVHWLSSPTPALVSLARADALPDRVSLVWYRALAATGDATIERRGARDGWAAIGSGAFDGAGQLRFVDLRVSPGERYGYRLSWIESGTEAQSTETWVDVPATLRFALEGSRPNPAVSELQVGFTLASDEPATLELVDVSGRRLDAREVSGLGAGRHLIRLDGSSRMPPGVYWLRLTQSGRTLARRTVFVR